MSNIVVKNALKWHFRLKIGEGLEDFFGFGKIALDTKVKIYYN